MTPEEVAAERKVIEKAYVHRPRANPKIQSRDRTKSDRFTRPADAMEALRASMRANPGAPERLYKCGVCLDSGWMEISSEGRGKVAHCRRGCEVPKKHNTEAPPETTKRGKSIA